MLLREQSDISPQRAMAVENVDDSSKVITESAETVQLYYYNSGTLTSDAGQAAGVNVIGKLAYGPVLDGMGTKVANKGNSSLSFTCLALTNERPLAWDRLEGALNATGTQLLALVCADFANGDYAIDYRTGTVYAKKATTATSMTSVGYKRPSSTSTVDVGDIEIGAVEMKDGATDNRAIINDANTARAATDHVLLVQNIGPDGTPGAGGTDIDDASFTPATSKFQTVGATVTNDNVDQADKGALAMTLDRRLKVDGGELGDGFGSYSNARGDFTATITNGAKTITITGLPFTLEAGHVQAIVKVDSSGNRYTMPTTGITVSGGVITVTDMPTAGFVTGDTVSVLLVGPTKTYDRTLDVQKTSEGSPLNQQFVEESIADTTNVADGTYYPSSTGMPYGGYKNLSITGSLIDGAGETTTLTVEVTDDEDTTNASWVQVYGYDSKNNTNVNSQAATNQTTTYAWDFDNFNYRHLRFKIAATAATNTVIIKCRRAY